MLVLCLAFCVVSKFRFCAFSSLPHLSLGWGRSLRQSRQMIIHLSTTIPDHRGLIVLGGKRLLIRQTTIEGNEHSTSVGVRGRMREKKEEKDPKSGCSLTCYSSASRRLARRQRRGTGRREALQPRSARENDFLHKRPLAQ